MSKVAVLAFINATDSNPELKAELSEVKGTDAVVRFAAEHGFEFSVEEFRPVKEMLRFLHDARANEAMRKAMEAAADVDAVATLAQMRGYEFTADELAHVSVRPADDASLSDEQLEAVAGGAGIDNDMQVQSGLRVQLQQSRDKTTTGKSFSDVAASGLNKSADTVMSAGQLAAPYIPGGSVLSAAMSG